MNTLFQHSLVALHNLEHKTQLVRYCNEHGYAEQFGRPLTIYTLNRYPERVRAFLNGLQEDLDFQQFARDVEVQEPTII